MTPPAREDLDRPDLGLDQDTPVAGALGTNPATVRRVVLASGAGQGIVLTADVDGGGGRPSSGSSAVIAPHGARRWLVGPTHRAGGRVARPHWGTLMVTLVRHGRRDRHSRRARCRRQLTDADGASGTLSCGDGAEANVDMRPDSAGSSAERAGTWLVVGSGACVTVLIDATPRAGSLMPHGERGPVWSRTRTGGEANAPGGAALVGAGGVLVAAESPLT